MDSNYLQKVYNSRYFIFHLVKWDMKYRFRRSKLGILWTIIQPLLFTVILSAVFSIVFHIPIKNYAPYVLSGILGWDVLLSGIVNNSYAFIKAEGYIKQASNPVIIYPIRESLTAMTAFSIAAISLVIWVGVIFPENLIIGLISLPMTLFLYFCLSLPLTVISSHIHLRFRDYPYVMNLLMQLLWYLSPVFFEESMFKGNEYLYKFFQYNPVTSILALLREPFLYGRFPGFFTYSYVLALIVLFAVIAYFVNKKCEKDIIFYI